MAEFQDFVTYKTKSGDALLAMTKFDPELPAAMRAIGAKFVSSPTVRSYWTIDAASPHAAEFKAIVVAAAARHQSKQAAPVQQVSTTTTVRTGSRFGNVRVNTTLTERQQRERSYDLINNEGAEGYNPHRSGDVPTYR